VSFFNICIVRPEGYIWSSLFLDLADLISFSLRDLGLDNRILENRIDIAARNIVIGCHLMDIDGSRNIPADTIFFNTEQIGGLRNPLWAERISHFLSRFPSWDYSEENIRSLTDAGIAGTRLFRFGYHPKLKRIPDSDVKDIDILFYGSHSEARKSLLDSMVSHGMQVTRLQGVFGAERDHYIGRSKIVLNLHLYESKVFEIVRVHYLMNNGKAVLSQCDSNSKMDPNYSNGLTLVPYEDLVSTARKILDSEPDRRQLEVQSLRQIMAWDAVEIMRELVGNPC
jgi:hypothetical protein